ncbi:MAG: MFS transporter [Phycisphaerales bacterium]|nr:MFS transporter [Phycisphaerales bacterium]
MRTQVAEKSTHPVISYLIAYLKDFRVLRETRIEYWALQIVNFLDCTIFFAMLNIATVMLSDDFGFSDKQAGWVLTAFSSGTTICLLFSGLVTDWLGIRVSMYVAMGAMLLLRVVVVWVGLDHSVPFRGTIVTGAFILMAPFMAMIQTMFQAANKRFTTGKSRSAGFNLWYLFMNVGAAAGGFLIDIVRLWLELPNAHIFTYGVFAAVASIVMTLFFIRREEQLYGPSEQPAVPAAAAEPVKRLSPWENFTRVMASQVFWRFTILITLLLGVRAVFAYMYLLFPKYWLRVIGPDAKMGTLQAINPILIIFGLIVLIPILHRFNVYKMLVYGAMISALSLFIMAIPSYGVETYYVSIAALIALSIGELIWSPRLTEYTAAIAPEGQEGVYLGLSMLPWFFAKMYVSFFSGYWLERFVPELPEGELLRDRLAAGAVSFWDSPSALWIYLGIPAILGPLVALLFKSFFTKGAKFEKSAAAAH